MKKAIDFIKLKKEAYLFDTKLYIFKTFVAVLTAYLIGHRLPFVQKDMISILFGMMMTLEPVTVTGIRSGLNQIVATILGALATTVIIMFIGINFITVALSVSATILLCLKINWREVSPVAIFTSIYMTQYVQYTVKGEPSETLTFLLRILALSFGVLIAILYNFLFSLFFYQRMERKRIAHLFGTISAHLEFIKVGLIENQVSTFYREKETLSSTFAGIDWLTTLLRDKEREEQFKKRISPNSRHQEVAMFKKMLRCLRNITHLIYDMLYLLTNDTMVLDARERKEIAGILDQFIKECNRLAIFYESNKNEEALPEPSIEKRLKADSRMMNDLVGIRDMLNRLKVIQI